MHCGVQRSPVESGIKTLRPSWQLYSVEDWRDSGDRPAVMCCALQSPSILPALDMNHNALPSGLHSCSSYQGVREWWRGETKLVFTLAIIRLNGTLDRIRATGKCLWEWRERGRVEMNEPKAGRTTSDFSLPQWSRRAGKKRTLSWGIKCFSFPAVHYGSSTCTSFFLYVACSRCVFVI